MTAIGRLARRSALLMVASGVVVAGVAATRADLSAASAAEARFHLKLLHAQPENDETLSVAPKGVQLWFSEAPEVAVSAISMIDAAQSPITMSTAHVGDKDKKGNPSITATVEKPLTAGTYFIRWRVTAKDGHLVKGSYRFVVTTAATETR